MGLFTGPSAAVRGLGLLFSGKGLLPLALIPAVAGLGLSMLGLWAAAHFGDGLVATLWPEPSGWFAHFFWSIFTWIISLASAALALVITPWLVMLVGFPLCDPLMAKADALLGGRTVEAKFFAELRRTLASSLGIVALGLMGALVFFALGLVPGLGLITVPLVTFVWTPTFLAFDAMDPSLGRRQLEWKQKKALIASNLLTCVGLGLTGTLLLAVPVLNLIGLPVLALAGVIVVRDLENKGRVPKTPEERPKR